MSIEQIYLRLIILSNFKSDEKITTKEILDNISNQTTIFFRYTGRNYEVIHDEFQSPIWFAFHVNFEGSAVTKRNYLFIDCHRIARDVAVVTPL